MFAPNTLMVFAGIEPESVLGGNVDKGLAVLASEGLAVLASEGLAVLASEGLAVLAAEWKVLSKEF